MPGINHAYACVFISVFPSAIALGQKSCLFGENPVDCCPPMQPCSPDVMCKMSCANMKLVRLLIVSVSSLL